MQQYEKYSLKLKKIMKEEILMMVQNYELGFISPLEFLLQYRDYLQILGAHKCVEDKINETLSDLAGDVAKMLKSGNAKNNMIEHHGTAAFN